jgi:hypothetical protein
LGTGFAVATSASALALEYLVGKAEAVIILDKQRKGEAIAVVVTVVINAPQVLLLIGFAISNAISISPLPTVLDYWIIAWIYAIFIGFRGPKAQPNPNGSRVLADMTDSGIGVRLTTGPSLTICKQMGLFTAG